MSQSSKQSVDKEKYTTSSSKMFYGGPTKNKGLPGVLDSI
jgi:hypothetical protein